MNIFASLFGIFRQRGLVSTLKEGQSLTSFTISSILVSILGGGLYGLAMGAGLGMETAIKDMVKMGLIVVLGLLFSIPIFWISFRLLGREEKFGQVAAIPLTLGATASILLAITSPIVFMLSVLAGFSPDAIYIHIVIIDLAILVGLYLAGTLIYHGFSDRKRLITPNVVGFLMMGVIVVVLMIFLSPFLSIESTFSIGTDRLKDGLGIGVADRASQSLAAVASADRLKYHFQTTNDNGDLIQDYTVTRVGNDYLLNINLHAIPGETFQKERRIWILDNEFFTDFDDNRVHQVDRGEITSYLDPALPPGVFMLPSDFTFASWRAYESSNQYSINGTSQNQSRATLILDSISGKLTSFTLGSSQKGLQAVTRVREIETATLNREGLETSLNQAIILGSIDQSDASMKAFIQNDTFFILRYPRSWLAKTWSTSLRQIEFTSNCAISRACPDLTANVFDLVENKGPQQYADDLGKSLNLQPQNREIAVRTITIPDGTVGFVEYIDDETILGKPITKKHSVYIFVGQAYRYHLDFSAPETDFETYRELFEVIAEQFSYLKELP